MKHKRVGLVLLCIMLLVSMAACGKQEEKTEQKDVVYESENIIPDAVIEGIVTSFTVWNDKIYMYTSPWETADYDEEGNAVSRENVKTGKWYCMNFDGKQTKELSLPDVNGKIENVNVTCGKDALWLMLVFQKNKNYNYTIVQMDKDGKEQKRFDITKALQLDKEDQMEKLMVGKDGNVVVVTDKKIVIFDTNGEKITEVTPQAGYVESVVLSKNGDILSADILDNGIAVDRLDTDTYKWKAYRKITGDTLLSNNLLMSGSDCDFYYRDNLGIYGYDADAKKTSKIMDYAASNVYVENTDSICPIDDKRMLGIADARATDGGKLILYTKVAPEDVVEKKIITYGAIQLNTNMKNAIADFNHSNSKYSVEIKEYYKEDDPETKLALDLVSGDAPDIIDISGCSIKKYQSKGVLEDLVPFFERDEEIGLSDMIPAVADAIQADGKCYYVAPGFRIAALAGKTSVVGDKCAWNMDDVIAIMKKYSGSQLLYDCKSSDILNLFLAQGASSFVDWQEGKCYFDQQRFRVLLEFCAEQGSNKGEYELGQETEYIQQNRVLLTPVTIGAEDLQVYDTMYKEPVTYKGYPSDERGGTSFVFPVQIAMSAKSQNKDGAWQFLRMLMTKQYQSKDLSVDSGDEVVVPTRQDVFELYQKERMITEAYTDETNMTILPMDLTVDYDGQEVQLKPMDEHQMQQFVDLVNNTNRVTMHEFELQQIVEDEAEMYFEGQQSLDKTIQVIQDRVTKYVNENR